jgi:ring-1,2-phenylacetyl-CoA epoxidase subunit PaaD
VVIEAVARPRATVAAIRAALAEVADPEIPAISIVDLGVVHDVRVDNDGIRVELLPTFIGCPALELIGSVVRERLSEFDQPVDVAFVRTVPWTSDRITPAGREALRRSGFAPPTDLTEVRCPYCDSAKVAMDSAFGPTQCRALFYCRGCRQPFEAFKPV